MVDLLRASVVLAVLLGWAMAPAPAAQKPVRLIAEAEDFDVVKGDWTVVPYGENYFASTFAITFLSRMACLGAPAQVAEGEDAVAAQRVAIPHAGEYRVLVRYEQPHLFSAEFAVEIEQKGGRVDRRVFGRLQDPKLWAFRKGKPSPMQRWFWGGGDNIVWQVGESVRLAEGEATIRLIAGPQMDDGRPRVMAAKRHVDLVCLTDDEAGFQAQLKTTKNYLPLDGWLVQDGDLYVRVTNPADGSGPCVPVIEGYLSGQHSPYWVHLRDWPATRLVRSGRIVSPTSYRNAGPHSEAVDEALLAPPLDPAAYEKIPGAEYLQPGQTSGWAPMGQALDALHLSKWMPRAEYLEPRSDLDLELEFAIPDGKGGLKPVKKVRVTGKGGYPHSSIGFEMPGNVRADPVIRTHLESLRWLKDQIAAFPPKGRTPERFRLYGIMRFSPVLADQGELGRLAAEIALDLGDNTMTRMTSPHAEALGVPRRRTALAVGSWSPDPANIKKKCDEAEAAGTLDQSLVISYGDEQYAPPVKIDDAQFADWLKQRGVRPDDPAVVTADPAHPLFYYSRLCAFEKGIEVWAECTRHIAQRTGGAALAGINYGPASHNMVDEINFVRAFKLGGMSLAWSEDYVWQMPEFSIQITGYRVSGFRAGAKYHDTPILMYIMPHSPGNTPRDLRLSFYTAVAHGTKLVNYFCATPSAVGTTENYIATRDVDMFRAVHDLSHETGIFEDYVMDGTVRPAEVGLLLSSVDDIRNPSTLPQGGHANAERKAIYYALRHAQVPVDFLSEDDVIDGLAEPYRLIYVTQEYLHTEAVTALTRWVRRGGTLVALCGGGFLDEFAQENPDTRALYGVNHQSVFKDDRFPVFQFKQDLPPYVPLDTASWQLGESRLRGVPVILWKQSLEPGDGRVVGRFDGGAPAVIVKEHGKGRAVLFGFMPGLAYLRSGLPLRPWDRGSTDEGFDHFLPTAMDAELRRALVDDFLPEDFVRPVACSETLVESTCIDTRESRRLAVPLMNYAGQPVTSLTVKVNGVNSARRVRSVERGPLTPQFEDGAMILTLPVGVTDMILIDR